MATAGARRERDHAAEPAHLARRDLGLGMGVRPVGQPRVADPVDVVARGQEAGDARPRSPQCRSTRRASVRSPRRTRKQSNGPGTAPIAFWRNRSRSARSSRSVTAIPLTVSEWPARYFVAEWNTMSAPSASGRWMAGEANVLSTTSSGRSPRAPWMGVEPLGDRLDVDHLEMRVRRRLEPDEPGPSRRGPSRSAPAGSVARSSQRVTTPRGPGDPLEVPPRAAVDVVAGEDRLARSDELGDRRRRGRAAGEGDPVRPPSSAATARSSRSRVGFWVRAYS